MERCQVSGEAIISSPYRVYDNHASHYSTRIKRIGKHSAHIPVHHAFASCRKLRCGSTGNSGPYFKKKTQTNHTENSELENLKNIFLRASAMTGWLKMLGQKIHLPPADHELYPFFSALSFLQEDIAARENIHEKKKQA